ncbi:MAG: UDP-N-acetylmuramate--L-alanine ligase [Acidimicrobiales bacterium]
MKVRNDTQTLDLTRRRRVHVVGVGGAGMSAIATVLVGMGHSVSGSDLRESANLDRLRAVGVEVFVGHDGLNVGPAEVLAISTAVPLDNPEVQRGRQLGLAVHSRAEVLAAIAARRRVVAVAGTHGKTTTSSMLALVLVEAGLHPSFIIGGELNEIGGGAIWDSGPWMVVEADESDGTFLRLAPEVALITNVEPDHLETYGSFEALTDAFSQFLAEASGPTLVCADDPVAANLSAVMGPGAGRPFSYGISPGADFRLVDLRRERSSVSFTLVRQGEYLCRVLLPTPGVHNALNAAGAAAAASLMGVEPTPIARALGRFGGVARRFQFRGQLDGVTFVDDYAHLPGEIKPMVQAARDGGWNRVVCVFQPHRYSRTESLWPSFADAFEGADLVVVTDVYPAGEAPRPGISGQLIFRAVHEAHPEANLAYAPSRAELIELLSRTLVDGDLCLTMGAGDLTSLPDEMMARGR